MTHVLLLLISVTTLAQSCLVPIIQVWGCLDNGWTVQTQSCAAPALQACLAPGAPPVNIGWSGLPDNNNILSPQCQFALLKLNYDAQNLPSDQPCVTVTTPQGSINQDTARRRWVSRAIESGRTPGQDAFQFPWNWRESPEHLVALTDVVAQLTDLIESASINNCNLPVLLVGDSCGAPLVTSFLANKTRDWKSKYTPAAVVEGDDQGGEFDVLGLFVPGNWGYIFFNDSETDHAAVNNWEGILRFIPQLSLYGSDTPIIYINSTNTNLTLGQFADWLRNNSLTEAASHWLSNQYDNPFPQANLSCIFATGATTARTGIFVTSQASTFTSGYIYSDNGDGEQPFETDSWCITAWTAAAQQAGLTFASKSWDNIHVPFGVPDAHTALPSDPKIWSYFKRWMPAFGN